MSVDKKFKVKNGASFSKNEELAVQELYDQIHQPDAEVVIFFCSSKYDLDKLGKALKTRFSCNLIGCTTSGEINSSGYHEGSLVGTSLATNAIKIHPRYIFPLSKFSMTGAESMADSIRKELQFSSDFNNDMMFGFFLVDGLSMLEERVISFIYSQFSGVPIIGGSAGDDIKFKSTEVYWDGRFVSDAAVFTIFETTLPFYTFKTQHFQPTGGKLVITEADPANRRVIEIDGEPAARKYAEILGLKIDKLTPMVFSNHPLMLKIGGEYYVRSIQKVNENESLSFFCAIDNGLVLSVAEGIGLVENLENQLSEIKKRIPNLKFILGCDCILRRLEIKEKKLTDDIDRIIKDYPIIGFSTYGEQYNSVHVNQTLTGIAIGDGKTI